MKRLKAFFTPTINRRVLLRAGILAISAFILFRYVALPFYIVGDSMAPTYRTGNATLVWRLRYLFTEPSPGDIVFISLSEEKEVHIKRVVALSGDEVEFRNGELYVNGEKIHEPYSTKPSYWNHGPVVVEDGHVFVVGDNRSMPRREHEFGSVEKTRIIGSPLW